MKHMQIRRRSTEFNNQMERSGKRDGIPRENLRSRMRSEGDAVEGGNGSVLGREVLNERERENRAFSRITIQRP